MSVLDQVAAAIDRWPRMVMHRQRRALLRSRRRFVIVPGGRRSGKTVEAKQRLILGTQHFGGNHHGCLTPPPGVPDPTFIYAAPTYAQAKRIVWEQLKAEIPKVAIARKSETDLSIRFVTGSTLYVIGMDKPERAEGIACDGAVLDEFADMRPAAWYSTLRPTLSTRGREGWAMFIGRPRRGKGQHFRALFEQHKNDQDWDIFYPWPSWVILSPAEIAAARRDLDEMSFRQEYGGEFLDEGGGAYYQFGPWNLAELHYDPREPLQFCFDFNVRPGVAVVCQDIRREKDVLFCDACATPMPGRSGNGCRLCGTPLPYETVTAVIGEVWRWDEATNTRLVCLELIEKWGQVHRGPVICYGDATGGARKTSAERSDWQTIEDYLGRQWPVFEIDVPSVNPNVRDRVVVVNSRLKNASDEVRILIDQSRAPHLAEDLRNTGLKPNGELDEGAEGRWTHASDALGYQQVQRFGSPVTVAGRQFAVEPLG